MDFSKVPNKNGPGKSFDDIIRDLDRQAELRSKEMHVEEEAQFEAEDAAFVEKRDRLLEIDALYKQSESEAKDKAQEGRQNLQLRQPSELAEYMRDRHEYVDDRYPVPENPRDPFSSTMKQFIRDGYEANQKSDIQSVRDASEKNMRAFQDMQREAGAAPARSTSRYDKVEGIVQSRQQSENNGLQKG